MSYLTDNCKKVLRCFHIYGGVLLREIEFLVSNGMDADKFIDENKGIRGVKLLKSLNRERELLMENTKYESCDEFIEEYHKNEIAALERLFGEFMNPSKTRHINVSAEDLYRLHIKYPRARLMEVLLHTA